MRNHYRLQTYTEDGATVLGFTTAVRVEDLRAGDMTDGAWVTNTPFRSIDRPGMVAVPVDDDTAHRPPGRSAETFYYGPGTLVVLDP